MSNDHEESRNYDHVIHHLQIYKAALHDDWDSVENEFEEDKSKMTGKIAKWDETPLHIAVGTNSSHKFVEKLVEKIGNKEELFQENCYGNNPLQFAAMVGNTTAAKLLVDMTRDMTRDRTLVPNLDGNTPLQLAAWHGNRETLKYLLTKTPDKPLLWKEETVSPDQKPLLLRKTPYTGVAGGDLITQTIMAGFYDVALEIIHEHKDIVFENNRKGQTALQTLAQKPESFASGRRLGLWGRFIYSLIPIMRSEEAADQGKLFLSRILSKFIAGFWSALGYVAPTVKSIHDIKVDNHLSISLVKLICKIVIQKEDHDKAWNILGSAMVTAVKYGARELIEECIVAYPGIVWYGDGGLLFIEAIKHRQERVYNLVYQMTAHKVFVATHHDDKDQNALHIVAYLAPPHQLNVVTGAALQMQRELQWFQEVEKLITQLSYKEALNDDNKTPRMVFTDEHKDLLKEGQQWMKDTSSSCTVVAALIVTMAFAAAFTLPGGNQDDGKPMFLKLNAFMLFLVSDSVALFSSSTSVLMFLGILTSRYAEDDFLYALPKRLTIGLLSLFISIAATMIAFSSALALVLRDKVTWVAAPLVIATSIPVCLFGLLQFPLLVELVKSTYGRSIFHQQNARMIH